MALRSGVQVCERREGAEPSYRAKHLSSIKSSQGRLILKLLPNLEGSVRIQARISRFGVWRSCSTLPSCASLRASFQTTSSLQCMYTSDRLLIQAIHVITHLLYFTLLCLFRKLPQTLQHTEIVIPVTFKEDRKASPRRYHCVPHAYLKWLPY